MSQLASESEKIRQIHALAKELVASDNPVVENLSIQILGLSKLLLAEILPDDFEHVSLYERGSKLEPEVAEAVEV